MKILSLCLAAFLVFSILSPAQGGEFRIGAHANYLNPADSAFSEEFGYGGILKYKFTDTLGIEIGGDYFRWEIDELTEMPFSVSDPSVYYREVDRVFPLYFTALIFAPFMEQDARAYLGLGGGYNEIDSTIEGNYNVVIDGKTYPFTIDGKVKGQWTVHAAVGADFELSRHIFLNIEARYVITDVDREMTHSNPTKGSVTVKDEIDFDNWQIRGGLEYSF